MGTSPSLCATALESTTLKNSVEGNTSNVEDPKIMNAFVRDTLLLAYESEGIEPKPKKDIKLHEIGRKWTFFQHFWAHDHKPLDGTIKSICFVVK